MSDIKKEEQIKSLVIEMLKDSNKAMIKKIDSLLLSGCIDVGNWNNEAGKMVLPKCIVAALLDSEITQFSGKGTSYEKRNKKEIKNIRYFL